MLSNTLKRLWPPMTAFLVWCVVLFSNQYVRGCCNNLFLWVAIALIALWGLAVWQQGFLLSSPNKWKHTCGLCIKKKVFTIIIGLAAVGYLISYTTGAEGREVETLLCKVKEWGGSSLHPEKIWSLLVLFGTGALIVILALTVKSALLRDNRSRRNAFNFWIQSFILAVVGVMIVGCVEIFHINSSNFLLFGIFASLMSWIFQDIIKGVVAFYNLYFNDLIHIGDWVELPAKGVDGIVEDISLINVTFRNWDETKASIPTATLLAEHMINYQQMLEGKTYGRRMLKTFIIDTSTVREMNREEIEALRSELVALGEDVIWIDYNSAVSSRPSVLNVTLFRLHLHHWLMNHRKISRHPRLLVRLMNPTPEGLPLQVYAFITEYSLQPFEMAQSEIVEYVMKTMRRFGLRHYQRPTGYDFIHLSKNDKDDTTH